MRSTAILCLLAQAGMSVRAIQLPFLQSDDQPPSAFESINDLPFTIDITSDGEPVEERIIPISKEESVKWKCEIRSWVRAPDLRPSAIIPAETRLSANGSDCEDIERWEVGLRFRERAIVKFKSKSLADDAFPKKPIFPRFNESSWPRYDYNDIYFVGGNMGEDPWEVYNAQMKEYNLAIKNESLWDVHGSERIVFDIAQALPYNPADSSKINEVRSFEVGVPNTNFPPIEKHGRGFISGGDGDNLLNTETMLEYYHLLHLSNGTTLDIPAGRTAFIPYIETASTEEGDEGWSTLLNLTSGRIQPGEEQDGMDEWFSMGRYGSNAPECDKGNMANFSLQVSSNVTHVTQGLNITLNFTLTRTGNGTEYPAYFQVQTGTRRNVTWAWNFVESDNEYDTLLGYSGPRRRSGERFEPPVNMLQLPSMRELEDRRNRNTRMSGSYNMAESRFPLNYGESRFDIEMDGEVGKEEYVFQMEVTIPDDQFPSFESTFETYRSILEFRLSTIFLCEPSDPFNSSPELDDSQKEDKEWAEYELPPKREKNKLRIGRHLTHTGSIPVQINLANRADTEKNAPAPTHYLHPDALGPIISLPSRQHEQHFGKLGSAKEESKDLLRKNRYTARMYDEYRPGRVGGAMMHAARLWEKKLRTGSDE
ncbi:hypothetical protein I302_100680 [Kwoniella bestiolae CBS 10118]|uniref:Uncharacterized protein n=1 Tax=Kwoniella bestiolae CBS 10118 TaxID=1296100 RepID=A0A1B9G5U7_9TREE|nr:hypothetical protein I302_04055 [Kwoniella bestiolae CBS 10118]OCF26372.1 hypothetical protein I302_04055 [Kwoniella bestiolae CBS 10118]